MWGAEREWRPNSPNFAKKSGLELFFVPYNFSLLFPFHQLPDRASEFCQDHLESGPQRLFELNGFPDSFAFLTYKTVLVNARKCAKFSKDHGRNDFSRFTIFLLFSLTREGFRTQPIPEKCEKSFRFPHFIAFPYAFITDLTSEGAPSLELNPAIQLTFQRLIWRTIGASISHLFKSSAVLNWLFTSHRSLAISHPYHNSRSQHEITLRNTVEIL